MNVTTSETEIECKGVREMLSRVGEKWTIQVVVALRPGSQRFNEIARKVNGISQQMLTRTLKTLERDGMLARIVLAGTPPGVEYSLTSLGHSLADNVRQLAEWTITNQEVIERNRLQYEYSLYSGKGPVYFPGAFNWERMATEARDMNSYSIF
ncbi:winged helix-turn-helix transcriptional regulator [Microbulbifer litoralis]|uniref:winged helix-turn-helix transcriptional regulator n=1 Tax=Microbulbifer litoralis TaxID=2933965 RepID=UPI002028DF5A|nr:helix-turn-helix domain-containing protein [Microbulbifer sp. GX H0434]